MEAAQKSHLQVFHEEPNLSFVTMQGHFQNSLRREIKPICSSERKAEKKNTLKMLNYTRHAHETWDNLINAVVQLRLQNKWNLIIMICEWILDKGCF